ncbi:MAG TPA: SDR family oxidoreductase [Clostridiaceae bacterium]|nr:SDR family oxidoreductase [Clostridiaceae bacterium]
MNSDKRTAIVTGAAKGIGKAIALRLASDNFITILFDIDETSVNKARDEINNMGFESSSYAVNIADVSQVENAISDVIGKFGRIDVLVNNAGVLSTTPVEDVTEKEWQRVMDVNLKGLFFITQKVIPYMLSAKYGRIVNIASNSGRAGGISSGVIYSISKAGVIGASRSLARIYAGTGITVNSVAPGTVASDIIDGFTEEELNRLLNTIPVHRLGTPEEIAAAVSYLASDLSGFTTGATIDVNGGLFIG